MDSAKDPPTHATPAASGRGFASMTLLASAAVGAVGAIFLVLMYAAFAAGARSAGMTFGGINDVAAIAQFALAVPGILAMGRAFRTTSPRFALVGTAIAMVGIAVIIVFQALLVAGTLGFEQEIGPVTVGFVFVGVWYVAAALVGRRVGFAPAGVGTAVVAALYLGYPVWAWRVARRLDAAF
jgi:hypothetical protein